MAVEVAVSTSFHPSDGLVNTYAEPLVSTSYPSPFSAPTTMVSPFPLIDNDLPKRWN